MGIFEQEKKDQKEVLSADAKELERLDGKVTKLEKENEKLKIKAGLPDPKHEDAQPKKEKKEFKEPPSESTTDSDRLRRLDLDVKSLKNHVAWVVKEIKAAKADKDAVKEDKAKGKK